MSVFDLVPHALRGLSAYNVPHFPDIRAKLDANENPWEVPPAVAADLAAHLARVPLNRYPDGQAALLRAHIAAELGVVPARVLFGNGSDELIGLVISAFARPRPGTDGARVLWPSPSFAIYRIATLAAGCQPVEVPLRPDFTLDEERLAADIASARPNLVFFSLPNNPTGTLWPRHAVLSVLEKNPHTLVVADEAYVDYTGRTMIDLLTKHQNLIVMRTLSKLGLAALRVGFVVADERVIHEIDKIRPAYNVGSLNQAAALWLLQHHRPLLEARVRDVIAERARLYAALEAHPECAPFPTEANFILFRHPRAGELWQQLVARGVLVRNLDRPGLLAGCLRVNVGTPAENDLFLEALS